ncbi:nurim homolog [Diorhabda sublineata]|uniref:nurim homolog n=1 Tax=Diorhabda sublineata TaxID=1163346 RepID=UPI0024E08119|nr:nurim homolog [Diorhabda sublineata]
MLNTLQISRLFQLILSGFGMLTTFYMITELTYFLSVPQKLEPYLKEPELMTSWALLTNMMLLSLFILQHSLLSSSRVKEAFEASGFQVLHRSVYVMSTSGILLYLLRHWKSTPSAILWAFNLNYKPLWWLYVSIHTVAWIIIYVGNICCDVTELLGIKQVYYNIMNLPDPNLRKSKQWQRLNNHIRHPSFLAFALIFWTSPIMSFDRILLAVILTTYMYIAWNPDGSDYDYQKYQFERKHFRLDHF